jgi:uncharacterized membrane protein
MTRRRLRPTTSSDDRPTAPTDAPQPSDELAVSPSIGPLPPIHVARLLRSTVTSRPLGGKPEANAAAVHRETVRVVAFSDAVFAITVTLLVLEIRPPIDDRNLLHELLALWPSYLAYAVTFLFIGQVWANHHVMFDHIRAADRVILLVNTLLLMVVAFLPFATSVLAEALRSAHEQRTAVVFYGIAFVVTALTFNAVWRYARRHRLVNETLDPTSVKAISRRFQLALAWLVIGTVLGALLPVVGVAVIAAFNAFYWLPIRGESPAPDPDAERAAPPRSPKRESSPTTSAPYDSAP